VFKPREADKIKNGRNGKGGGHMLENAFRAHSKILRLSGVSVKAQSRRLFLSIPIQAV
jgi:hypothetical protein